MPYTPEERKRAVTRLRRIRGQAEALIRAVEAGTNCADLLQQIVAMRGATNGLVAEVFESYLRATFGSVDEAGKWHPNNDVAEDIEAVMKIMRTHMK
ncbi:metal/formaldehyde-sensitive transcriptional repressor [Planctomicrobium sp. SH527]|uniref:metal/formaldehyde-sensitive transcriptional repressor n=1 Tax=Planctomicrobium sp. SH527 TaxID=3448123 RepID=UPI003F5BC888